MSAGKTFDVIVVGAGVFGAWTAWNLTMRGQRVLLLDAYGIAHARASSGGETRIIRMGYGSDEIYTRWSNNSLVQWKALFAVTGQPLFHNTGVLWLSDTDETRLDNSRDMLKKCGIPLEMLQPSQLEQRYPQVNFADVSVGMLEPESGVLLARRAVSAVVTDAVKNGASFQIGQVAQPRGKNALDAIQTSAGDRLSAGNYVFACGPWLGKVFTELLGPRIFPTRQEIFFFGAPPGDSRFAPPALPTWLFQGEEVYGMPDIESRGLKFARDIHGPIVDPDTQSRVVSEEQATWARHYVAWRFPALKDGPIVETRVCQYENTSNGDFLIDRHPELSNVWLAGGGSGHGFKHGPAFGEYLAKQILGEGTVEPRFSLASKDTARNRVVF
jgi:sarcosine oxidase